MNESYVTHAFISANILFIVDKRLCVYIIFLHVHTHTHTRIYMQGRRETGILQHRNTCTDMHFSKKNQFKNSHVVKVKKCNLRTKGNEIRK